jgi:hypothetical protein
MNDLQDVAQNGGQQAEVVVATPLKSGLVMANVSTYPVVTMQENALGDIMRENVGTGLNRFDLDRIKMPTSGSTIWSVPTLGGDTEVKTIDGIIIHWQEVRAFWRISYDDSGGGIPPDCSSNDAIHGQGDPGGDCLTCPFAKFGTATKGDKQLRGQACRAGRVLFFLRPGDIIPLNIVVPPTSLKSVKQYMLRLANAALPYYGVVTQFGLEQDKNADGLKYSRVVPKAVGYLGDAALERVRTYSQSFKPVIDAATFTQGDLGGSAA